MNQKKEEPQHWKMVDGQGACTNASMIYHEANEGAALWELSKAKDPKEIS